MALGVTSHFSTMLEPIASASFLSNLSIIYVITSWIDSRVKKREIAGIEPSPRAAKVARYCRYEKNRNDLPIIHSFIHSYADKRIERYRL